MTETIQYIKPDGTPGSIVACYPTPSEHFVITAEPTISYVAVWNLTHKKTTTKVIGPFATQEEVRLMAAILAALPFAWGEITLEYVIGPEKMKEKFRRMWSEALPDKLLAWFKTRRDDCMQFNIDMLDEQDQQDQQPIGEEEES